MKQLITRSAALLAFGLLSVGCSSSTDSGLASGDAGGDGAISGHSLSISATLKAEGTELPFITPAGSTVKVAASTVVGKPYLASVFPAGFSSGNEPALDFIWGVVPADLKIRYSTPAKFQDGAYDMTLILYLNTPISEELKKGSAQFAPVPKGGDVATFSSDTSRVHDGDPAVPLGMIRVNIEGADGAATVDNKIAADPSNPTQVGAALYDTLMILP